MPTRDVLILLFDGVQGLDVTGPLDVFAGANARLTHRGRPAGYRITTASVDARPATTSSGLTLTPGRDLRTAPTPHTVIAPGGWTTRHPHPDIVDWLRTTGGHADRVVSVCTGAFLLAEAGLLTGRTVTTHWGAADQLARRYPDITVDPEPIFVRDGHIATSAGVTAGIDLALALVEEDHDRDLALTVARDLVVFLRRPGNQTQFSAQLRAQTAHRQPLRDVQQWITEHPDADLTIEHLARRANLSPRQFARAFTAETGATPGQYVDRTRLETARRLLEDTTDGVENVARHSGYRTPEAMRRAFQRTLGVSPAEYRRRF
jgi:transcriptional regulator GlxA family with amidase domain